MAIQKIRGLRDIRTLSGSVNQVFQSYKAYMKISCLEMEKIRRKKERQSASMRIKNIDTRFQEIEAEKSALLKILDKQNSNCNSDEGPGIESKPTPRRSTGGFKIRY